MDLVPSFHLSSLTVQSQPYEIYLKRKIGKKPIHSLCHAFIEKFIAFANRHRKFEILEIYSSSCTSSVKFQAVAKLQTYDQIGFHKQFTIPISVATNRMAFVVADGFNSFHGGMNARPQLEQRHSMVHQFSNYSESCQFIVQFCQMSKFVIYITQITALFGILLLGAGFSQTKKTRQITESSVVDIGTNEDRVQMECAHFWN